MKKYKVKDVLQMLKKDGWYLARTKGDHRQFKHPSFELIMILKQHIMEKIIVNVAWCDKIFGGSLGSNVPGAVVFTAPTFEALQKEAKDSLEFHVEGLVENGEEVPEWLKNGDYEFVYNYQDATTLLKAYSPYVSLAAISRASGIKQSLLSHYVNGLKKPREQQRKRIVDGLHKIGSDLQSVMCV